MKAFKRRDFFKKLATVLAAVSLAPNELKAKEMLKVDNPTAKALGYHPKASDVDPKKWPKFANEKMGKNQNCANCQLYKPVNSNKGDCTLFVGKWVPAEAWCNGWIKKRS